MRDSCSGAHDLRLVKPGAASGNDIQDKVFASKGFRETNPLPARVFPSPIRCRWMPFRAAFRCSLRAAWVDGGGRVV